VKFDSVIVRFGGEIGIKGKWTRRTYEKLLSKNIKKALKRHGISHEKIIQKSGRIYIKTKNAQETASKLTQVFGVSSVSPAIEITAEMNESSLPQSWRTFVFKYGHLQRSWKTNFGKPQEPKLESGFEKSPVHHKG